MKRIEEVSDDRDGSVTRVRAENFERRERDEEDLSTAERLEDAAEGNGALVPASRSICTPICPCELLPHANSVRRSSNTISECFQPAAIADARRGTGEEDGGDCDDAHNKVGRVRG